MSSFIRTPFKSDGLETDPIAYGLRPEELRLGLAQLLNDKSILITGFRGIGKSSFCYQLQNVLIGDKTLLDRCCIKTDINKYIIVNYTCTPNDTLESIILLIVNLLKEKEEYFREKNKIGVKEFNVKLFGMFEVKLEEEKTKQSKFTSLTTNFINLISEFAQVYVNPHINISIDELDQVESKVNLSHFIKNVLEQLDRKSQRFLSFILVGQNILFDLLYSNQPAFHRLFKHIRLMPLDEENASYVIDACLKRSGKNIIIENDAMDIFLGLTNGYPYSIQLLGDESFNSMLTRCNYSNESLEIQLVDVVAGLKNIHICEEQRYKIIIDELLPIEKSCIFAIANTKIVKKLPLKFQVKDIEEGLSIDMECERKTEAKNIILSLLEKQIIIENDTQLGNEKQYSFQEEIFRTYLFYRINNKDKIKF